MAPPLSVAWLFAKVQLVTFRVPAVLMPPPALPPPPVISTPSIDALSPPARLNTDAVPPPCTLTTAEPGPKIAVLAGITSVPLLREIVTGSDAAEAKFGG